LTFIIFSIVNLIRQNFFLHWMHGQNQTLLVATWVLASRILIQYICTCGWFFAITLELALFLFQETFEWIGSALIWWPCSGKGRWNGMVVRFVLLALLGVLIIIWLYWTSLLVEAIFIFVVHPLLGWAALLQVALSGLAFASSWRSWDGRLLSFFWKLELVTLID